MRTLFLEPGATWRRSESSGAADKARPFGASSRAFPGRPTSGRREDSRGRERVSVQSWKSSMRGTSYTSRSHTNREDCNSLHITRPGGSDRRLRPAAGIGGECDRSAVSSTTPKHGLRAALRVASQCFGDPGSKPRLRCPSDGARPEAPFAGRKRRGRADDAEVCPKAQPPTAEPTARLPRAGPPRTATLALRSSGPATPRAPAPARPLRPPARLEGGPLRATGKPLRGKVAGPAPCPPGAGARWEAENPEADTPRRMRRGS